VGLVQNTQNPENIAPVRVHTRLLTHTTSMESHGQNITANKVLIRNVNKLYVMDLHKKLQGVQNTSDDTGILPYSKMHDTKRTCF